MLSTLIRASLDCGIVVAIVWLVVRLFRLSPATRAALWWCAAAKFVVALLWVSPVLVPILPASTAPLSRTVPSTQLETFAVPPATASTDRRIARFTMNATQWSTGMVTLWGVGCVLAAGFGLQRVRRMRSIVARSSPAPESVQEMASDLALRLGLRRVPRIHVSGDVTTPLVVGVIQPTVLLPTQGFDCLNAIERQMVICHELAHVKRGDLWLGCAPAIAERAFFFHPLAHLAAREYSLWREAACDAAVLEALDAAPREYGRLLLDFGLTRRRTGLAAAGAAWSFRNLKRRIVMLHDSSTRSHRSRALSVALVGLSALAIVPLQLSARPAPVKPATGVSVEAFQSQSTAREELSKQIREARERLRELELEHEKEVERERADARSLEKEVESTRERLQSLETERDDMRFVAFFADDQTTMSGHDRDVERARSFRRNGENMIWFTIGGREYVLRDPSSLQRVQEIWKTVYEIGEQQGNIGAEQGKIGAKQGEIGALQGELGARQGEIGALQGRLGEEQARLAAREAAGLNNESARANYDRERRKLEDREKALSTSMRELEAKLRELSGPMEELSRPMAELGKKMEVLGRRMEEEGRRARSETRRLFESAITNNTAEIVR